MISLISEFNSRKRVSRVFLPSSLDTGTNSQRVRGVRCDGGTFKEWTLARCKSVITEEIQGFVSRVYLY